MSAATLAARGLGKRYGDRVALDDVSFDLAPGELIALIGPNGAGKTTLLSILAGVQASDAGAVEVPAGVGWVPQQVAVYGRLTVAENLRLFARLEGVRDPEATVAAMLAQIGLADRADELVERLSGGNRQRVNIAVGILAGPAALLLDEPSSSLDPLGRERLWEFLTALAAQGTSVLYSTHNVAEAERFADRVLILSEGRLVFTGSLARLAERAGTGETDDFESAFVRFLRNRDR